MWGSLRDLNEDDPEGVELANTELFSILEVSGKLLTLFGQTKYLAGVTPRYLAPSLDQASLDIVFPTEAEKELIAAGPTPVLFGKAIRGLKRQRESDSHKEVVAFLKSVLG